MKGGLGVHMVFFPLDRSGGPRRYFSCSHPLPRLKMPILGRHSTNSIAVCVMAQEEKGTGQLLVP